MINGRIRIVIADDHQVFAQGLATLINDIGMQVTAVTDNRDDLLKILAADAVDVAIVDLAMPGIEIIDLLQALNEQDISTRLLVLTADDDPYLAMKLLEAGIQGYLLKEHTFDEIALGIRAVYTGKSYVSSQLASKVLRGKANGVDHKLDELTDRQRQILQLVADGDTSKRIARKLGLHVKTIDNHRDRIRHKLSVRSSAEMIRVAGERGLLGKRKNGTTVNEVRTTSYPS